MESALVVGLIIMVGLAMRETARLLRLPKITAYIAAGIVLNPRLTGWIPTDFCAVFYHQRHASQFRRPFSGSCQPCRFICHFQGSREVCQYICGGNPCRYVLKSPALHSLIFLCGF